MQKSANIFLGQTSGEVCEQINELLTQFEIEPLSYLIIEQENYSSCKRNSTLLSKCSHSCQDASIYCSGCKESITTLYETTRKLFEELDSTSSINIMMDLFNFKESWLYSNLINFIFEECKSPILGSILLKPHCGINGVDNYISSFSFSTSLESSSWLILRGFEEYLVNPKLDEELNQIIERSNLECSKTLAADLIFALQTHNGSVVSQGQFALWPYHICSNREKIIDVRSSLYKTLLKYEKYRKSPQKNNDYHPTRILANNVHSLYLYYQHKYPNFFSYAKMIRTIVGSYATLKYQKKSCRLSFIDGPTYDGRMLLNWATKGCQWNFLDNSIFREFDNINGSKEPAINFPRTTNPNDLNEFIISACSFRSIYAEKDILEVNSNTKRQLNLGLYAKHFSDDGFVTLDDIYQSTLLIDNIFYL